MNTYQGDLTHVSATNTITACQATSSTAQRVRKKLLVVSTVKTWQSSTKTIEPQALDPSMQLRTAAGTVSSPVPNVLSPSKTARSSEFSFDIPSILNHTVEALSPGRSFKRTDQYAQAQEIALSVQLESSRFGRTATLKRAPSLADCFANSIGDGIAGQAESKVIRVRNDLVERLKDRTGAKHTEDLYHMKARCSLELETCWIII